MKLMLAAASIAAIVATATPATAQTGWNFYQRCGTGAEAGFFNRGYCHDYLSGFYDAMAASHQICANVPPNDTQIVMVVQDYLRSHAAVLQNAPYHVMIHNAVLSAWGCRH